MATFDSLKFNWLPRPSAWQEMQNYRARQADLQTAADTTNAIISKLTDAGVTQATAQGNLSAKAALARIKAATAAKQKKQQDDTELAARNAPKSTTPKDITLSDGTVIKADPTITLAGGTKINPKNNTLTLGDGTLVNLLTGRKVDVTT
jgi:hypothetical protein